MNNMKPAAWLYRFNQMDEEWELSEFEVTTQGDVEAKPLYDTTAFRALVERVCDSFNNCQCSRCTEERARIRAALLAALGA